MNIEHLKINILRIAEELAETNLFAKAKSSIIFDDKKTSIGELSNTVPRRNVLATDLARKIYMALYDGILRDAFFSEIGRLRTFDYVENPEPLIEAWEIDAREIDPQAKGLFYHFSINLKGTKNNEPVSARMSLQIKLQEDKDKEQYTIYLPNFPEVQPAPLEAPKGIVIPDVGMKLSEEEKQQIYKESFHKSAPGTKREEDPKVIIEHSSKTNHPNLAAMQEDTKFIVKSSSEEDEEEYLSEDEGKEEKEEDTSKTNPNLDLAEMEHLLEEIQLGLPNQAPNYGYDELCGALIKSGGRLDEAQTISLTHFVKSIQEKLLEDPKNFTGLNAEVLFLLTWHNPKFFPLFRTASNLIQGYINPDLLAKVGKYYDDLLENYRKNNRDDESTRKKIGRFAKGVDTAVNQKIFPLGLALEMEVVHKTKITSGGSTIRLDAHLVSEALKSSEGIQELATLFNLNPGKLGFVLSNPDTKVALLNSVVGEGKLVRQLNPEGLQNLLPYGQGEYITPPGFFRSLGMRLGFVADPLQSLNCEKLLDIATKAQEIGNSNQVKAIIDRCSQDLGFTSRIAGQPDYQQQLLAAPPKALAQFFKLADANQINTLIAGRTERAAVLLNGIAAEEAKGEGYVMGLSQAKFNSLNKIVDTFLKLPALKTHLKTHGGYSHLNLNDEEEITSTLPAAIQALYAREQQNQAIRENIAAPAKIVEAIEPNPQGKNVFETEIDIKGLLVSLSNSKHSTDHAVDTLKQKLKADKNQAQDFIKTVLPLFDDLDGENNTRTRIMIIELLTELLPDEDNKTLITASLTGWLTVDNKRETVKKILDADANNIFTKLVLDYHFEESKKAANNPEFEKTLTKTLDIFEFLLQQEKARGFARNYLDTTESVLQGLAINALNQWLDKLHAHQDNSRPRFLSVYRNLFNDEKAHLVFDQVLRDKKAKCLELFDADADGKQKWLYKEKVFWLHLLSDPERFNKKLMNHGNFKVFVKGFVPLIPDLLSQPDTEQTNLATMIQSVLNISSPDDALDVLNKVYVGLKGLDKKSNQKYLDKVEIFLSKIFSTNPITILKLSTTENEELTKLLEVSTSFWEQIFSDKLLGQKFLDNKLKVNINKDNFALVEKVINSTKKVAVTEFVEKNSAKLGLEKSDQGWIFTKFKGKEVVSQPSTQAESVPPTMSTGHKPGEPHPIPRPKPFKPG